LLGTIDISRVIETVRTLFPISPDAELSIETNPGAIEPKHCADYQNAGVNRINIGVQSFSDANLKFLGRIHSSRDAVAAVKSIRRAGFNNLGLDLIYGIPGQSKKSWLIDLDKAMEFQPEHLSCYMLTYEPGTPMHQDLQKGCFRPQAEDLTADLFETTMSFLIDHGYVQYEISNFARAKRYMCRHNQKYWSGVPYIGLGPAAHSFVEPVRWRNTQQVKQYIKEIESGRFAVEGKETLNREQRMMERIYLGLRTTDGIQTDIFDDTFGVRFTERFNKIITDLKERGLIKFSKNRCALTKKGMLFQNSIASMFICSDG
jgi:oxygen-independent coproporphyrinogen-3 oxidase